MSEPLAVESAPGLAPHRIPHPPQRVTGPRVDQSPKAEVVLITRNSRDDLPASLPAIFSGLRIAHGFAWILIVVGEMTGVPTGLGSVVMDGRTLSRTDLVITGMVVIGACGFITDRIIVAISNRLLSWSPQHRE